MAERWWKMRQDTFSLIVSALTMARRDALWPRLLAPMCAMVRNGSQLGETEAAWLADWMEERGFGGADPRHVQVVQLSRSDAAALLDGEDRSAGRAIRALQEIGLLTLVHKGVKGHSALFCVNPPPKCPDQPAQ